MKYVIFIFLLAATSYSSAILAQDGKRVVKGTVLDSITNQPIEKAIVRLSADGISNAVLTKADGSFLYAKAEAAAPANLMLEISALGYLKKEIAISSAVKISDIGKVQLMRNATVLQEVIVDASKIVDVEKFTYTINHRDFPVNAKLAEVIKKVPLLSIDGDGNIKIQGRVQPVIFIDGKEIPREQVMNMTHEMISRIEVINNPPAKYSAELNGVVNIVTRKTGSDLFKGSVSAGAGFINPFYNTSANAVYKRKKLLMMFSASILRNTQHSSLNFTRNSAEDRLDQSSAGTFKPLQSSGNITAFYDIDSTKTLSLLLGYNLINETRDLFTQALYNKNGNTQNIGTTSNWLRNMFLSSLELEYKKMYKKNAAVLVLTGRTGTKRVEREAEFHYEPQNVAAEQIRNNDHSMYREMVFNASYGTNVLKKKSGRFETGFTAAFRETNGSYSYYAFDDASDKFVLRRYPQNFRFGQNVFAQYVSLRFTAGKFNFLPGIRNELTDNIVSLPDSNFKTSDVYYNFIPSISILTQLKNKASIKFNFTRRIKRPGWSYLSPFSYAETPAEQFSGNPQLRPEIRNNIELSYSKSIKKAFLYTSIYYTATNKVIFELVDNATGTIFRRTFKNVGRQNFIGASLSLSAPVFKKINVNTNLYLEHYDIDGGSAGFLVNHARGIGYGATMNVSTRILSKYFFSFYLSYDYLTADLQSTTYLNPLTDMSIYRAFFKDKLGVSLRYQDLFNVAIKRRTNYFDSVYTQRMNLKNEITNVILTLQYNFGKNFNASRRRVGIPLDDVKADHR